MRSSPVEQSRDEQSPGERSLAVVFFALVLLCCVALARIGDTPDCAAGIVGDEQRAVARDRKRRGPSPHFRAPLAGDPEAGDEILVVTFGPAVLERHAHHLVARRLRAILQRASGTMRYFRSVIVRLVFVGCAALAVAAFALGWVDRQGSLARAETSVQDDAKHNALKQNFLAEHEIGRRFRIDPAALPAPKTGPIVSNRALIVAYTGQAPQVPAGFTATPFATGLVNPRRLLVLPNGDVLVAEQSAGYLTLLRDDGSGHAVWIDRHVEDLNRPYGLAWQGDHVLVADQDGIWSVPHILGALRAGRSETLRVDQVPPEERKPIAGAYGAKMLSQKGVFGIVQGHQNRPLAVEPKSGALFVGVGSSGNVGVEPEPKATIQRFDADGSHQTTYASGMRNPTALAFQPQTGELYAAVQERDGLGDNLPSDYLTRVQQGGFYGWPYAYIGKHPQAGFANLAPDKVDATIVPDLLFQAHSSVLDFVFYDGEQFSAE